MKKFEKKRSLSKTLKSNKQTINISSLKNNFQPLQSERINKSSQSERNQENMNFQLTFFENLIDYTKSVKNKSLCLILSNKLNKLYLKTPNIYTINNNNNQNNNNNNNQINDNNNQINDNNNQNNNNNPINNNNNQNINFNNIYKHFTLILVSLLFMSKFEMLYKNVNKIQTYLIEFTLFCLLYSNKITSQKILDFLSECDEIHLSKTLNLFEITKNFSSTIFNIKDTYVNIEKCINDLNSNINNFSLLELISIINETILFCMDSKLNVNVEIEKKNSINDNENNINQPEIIKTPYITTPMSKKFCLVLDLDETITHNTPSNYFLVRPGTINFLNEVSKFYEIIIFTSAHQNYADNILNRLDPEKKNISFRFYKQHTYVEENKIIKNIKNLGRDLKKIIFIDNFKYVAKYSMENIYQIKTWIDDVFDNELERIKNKLIEIAKNKKYLKDVRKAIKELI